MCLPWKRSTGVPGGGGERGDQRRPAGRRGGHPAGYRGGRRRRRTLVASQRAPPDKALSQVLRRQNSYLGFAVGDRGFLLAQSGLAGVFIETGLRLRCRFRFSHRGLEIPTPRFVAAAHRTGRAGGRLDYRRARTRCAGCWTCGVDVIMTNRPRVLAEVLEQRGSHPVNRPTGATPDIACRSTGRLICPACKLRAVRDS